MDPVPFRNLQLEDPIYQGLIEFLDGKSLPSTRIPAAMDHFKLKEGVLYHVRDILPGLVGQQDLPPKVISVAMKIVHSISMVAHPSVNHIYKKLQDYKLFPNTLLFCRKFVQPCVAKGRAPLAANSLVTFRVHISRLDRAPSCT